MNGGLYYTMHGKFPLSMLNFFWVARISDCARQVHWKSGCAHIRVGRDPESLIGALTASVWAISRSPRSLHGAIQKVARAP